MKEVRYPFYMHFRRMEPDGNGGKRQASKYAATVCILPGGEIEHLCTMFNTGVAICSKKDQFCRKVGRDIARGRAASGRGLVLEIPSSSIEPTADELRQEAWRCVEVAVANKFDNAVDVLKDLRGCASPG